MSQSETGGFVAKISPQFKARLARARERAHLRVLLLLHTGAAIRDQRNAARSTAVASSQAAADAMLPDVERVLHEHGGRLLSDAPNALGSVAVETTPAGVEALAQLSGVRAVLEDQPLTSGPSA